MYKHLAGSFWVLRQNLQQVALNQEKPHTTPLHYLIYSIYISVVLPITVLMDHLFLLIRTAYLVHYLSFGSLKEAEITFHFGSSLNHLFNYSLQSSALSFAPFHLTSVFSI
jgi:hypothetical protein